MRMVKDRALVCAPTVPEFLEAQKPYVALQNRKGFGPYPTLYFKALFPRTVSN